MRSQPLPNPDARDMAPLAVMERVISAAREPGCRVTPEQVREDCDALKRFMRAAFMEEGNAKD